MRNSDAQAPLLSEKAWQVLSIQDRPAHRDECKKREISENAYHEVDLAFWRPTDIAFSVERKRVRCNAGLGRLTASARGSGENGARKHGVQQNGQTRADECTETRLRNPLCIGIPVETMAGKDAGPAKEAHEDGY